MPTEPDAATAAQHEAERWMQVAASVTGPLAVADETPPRESAVVGYFDPAADLAERGDDWGYQFTDFDLGDVCRFAAGLASAEADGWRSGTHDIATRAYAERRFLLSDRVLHWAVPWLDAMGRCYAELRGPAHDARDTLLVLGDHHRPAPDLAAGEGLFPPGQDAFGPTDSLPLPEVLGSLWSGAVILTATVRSITGRPVPPSLLTAADFDELTEPLGYFFGVAAARWRRLGAIHGGSAALWRDLSARATTTEARLNAL